MRQARAEKVSELAQHQVATGSSFFLIDRSKMHGKVVEGRDSRVQ